MVQRGPEGRGGWRGQEDGAGDRHLNDQPVIAEGLFFPLLLSLPQRARRLIKKKWDGSARPNPEPHAFKAIIIPGAGGGALWECLWLPCWLVDGGGVDCVILKQVFVIEFES